MATDRANGGGSSFQKTKSFSGAVVAARARTLFTWLHTQLGGFACSPAAPSACRRVLQNKTTCHEKKAERSFTSEVDVADGPTLLLNAMPQNATMLPKVIDGTTIPSAPRTCVRGRWSCGSFAGRDGWTDERPGHAQVQRRSLLNRGEQSCWKTSSTCTP